MGLTSEILNRYRRGDKTNKTRLTLVYKKAERRQEPSPIDMRRLSSELMRVTRPLMTAELKRSVADAGVLQKKNMIAFQKRMKSEVEKTAAVCDLTFARCVRRMEEHEEKRPSYPREQSVSLNDIESMLEKRLTEAGEELLGGTRRIARAEAEAVFRSFREEEEYQRLRGG